MSVLSVLKQRREYERPMKLTSGRAEGDSGDSVIV